jgi:hypothetical protein
VRQVLDGGIAMRSEPHRGAQQGHTCTIVCSICSSLAMTNWKAGSCAAARSEQAHAFLRVCCYEKPHLLSAPRMGSQGGQLLPNAAETVSHGY